MRAKLLTTICVLAIGLCSVTTGRAEDDSGPMQSAADALVVRPLCLAATVVGSAVFVLALPWAAASKSVKKTADTLVVKPANATFTRPLGDMEALKN
jgi:multisubunit Na+/H+ antiporter MnhC subunit